MGHVKPKRVSPKVIVRSQLELIVDWTHGRYHKPGL